jgi:hypothetical protein
MNRFGIVVWHKSWLHSIVRQHMDGMSGKFKEERRLNPQAYGEFLSDYLVSRIILLC